MFHAAAKFCYPWLKYALSSANEDPKFHFIPGIIHPILVGTGPWLHSQNQYIPMPNHYSISYYVCFHGGSLREKETDIGCVNRAYCRLGVK